MKAMRCLSVDILRSVGVQERNSVMGRALGQAGPTDQHPRQAQGTFRLSVERESLKIYGVVRG
ncbi:MAG: hypothetical protein GEEBNDBF_01723 [bacterium]|nr:hypothetical protein [bacterium]